MRPFSPWMQIGCNKYTTSPPSLTMRGRGVFAPEGPFLRQTSPGPDRASSARPAIRLMGIPCRPGDNCFPRGWAPWDAEEGGFFTRQAGKASGPFLRDAAGLPFPLPFRRASPFILWQPLPPVTGDSGRRGGRSRLGPARPFAAAGAFSLENQGSLFMAARGSTHWPSCFMPKWRWGSPSCSAGQTPTVPTRSPASTFWPSSRGHSSPKPQ